MKRVKLRGTIFSSRRDGKKFLELSWVKRQIMEKLGFAPYPGTLNLKLSEESTKLRKLLDKATSMKINPASGYCNGKLFKAFIGTFECAVVIPEVVGYPKDVLEIIASVNLREHLQLEDGCEVTVKVDL